MIVIECNLIGIKKDFFFYGYELSLDLLYISDLFGMSDKITNEHSKNIKN